MPASSRTPLVVIITGLVYALIGLALGGGGVWLAALGGSLYYAIAGLGILIVGVLLLARRAAALWVYAAVLIGTLIWALWEIGFDWWPLAARGDIIFLLALWLLTPWIAGNLSAGAAPSRRSFTLPLWAGVAASLVVLAIGLASNTHDLDGALSTADAAQPADDVAAQPDDDWRELWPHPIRPALFAAETDHARQRQRPESRLDLPHRRSARQERSGRDDFRGHADQGRRHALSLLAASAPVRARRQDRRAALVLRSEGAGQSDLPAPDLPRRFLSRERAGRARQRRRAGADRLSAHDLPARQRRADDRAQRRDRRAVPELRRSRHARSAGGHGRQDAGLLRADFAARRQRQDHRHRRRGDRQLFDGRAVRRHPRLRRAYRQAGLGLGFGRGG